MYILEHKFHRVPAALMALLYGIIVSSLLGLDARGVEVVGEIPGGLTLPRLPIVPLSDMLLLVSGAFGLALVSFAEAIGPDQSFARKHDYHIDPNHELIGLGMANMGAGLFQGFPIGSSLSNSAANDAAGAKSQLSTITAAVITIVIALFLTPIFRPLPEATLGAIVIIAISGMMNVAAMRRLFSARRTDFALAAVALLGVLIFDVLPGLFIAVILSLLALVYRASQPEFSVLGWRGGRLAFTDVTQSPEIQPIPGLLIVHPNEGIFFANAAALRQALIARFQESDPPARAMILDLDMSHELDVPGADMLAELYEDLEHLGATLIFASVHQPVREMLDRTGVTSTIGPEHIHYEVFNAVTAFLTAAGTTGLAEELRLLEDTARRMLVLVEQRSEQVTGPDLARIETIRAKLEELIHSFSESMNS